MFTSVGEINIICSHRERSLKFYTDVLGFARSSEEGDAVHLHGYGIKLLILPFAKPVTDWPAYASVPTMSFDLLTDDLPAVVKHLKKHGVHFTEDWQPDHTACFIRDPDGLVIEIIQN